MAYKLPADIFADYHIVEFNAQYTGIYCEEVLDWLIDNIPCNSYSTMRLSAKDADGNFVWRMNLVAKNKVLFSREEDAMLFALRWS